MLSLHAALSYANQKFIKIGLTNPGLDARLLLAFLLNKPESYILTHCNMNLQQDEYKRFVQLVKRRLNLEPIAYIIGQKEFYGHNFLINKNVLIPRPSTEILIDILLKEYQSPKNEKLTILDLGTGSGCIIITLLLCFPKAIGVGVDISNEALMVSSKNAKIHKVDGRLALIHSDWFQNLPGSIVKSANYNQKYDIIVANPPYVSKNEIDLMTAETLLFEPHQALFAYNNGLADYEAISKSAKNYLKEGGKLIVEIGFNQQQQVIDLFLAQSYQLVEKFQDLAGHNRAIMFNYNKAIKSYE